MAGKAGAVAELFGCGLAGAVIGATGDHGEPESTEEPTTDETA